MTNLDILIANQNSAMYSENENVYWNMCEQQVFDELKEETEG